MLIVIEILSVLFNFIYLYFAIRQNPLAWISGVIASLLSIYLFYENHYIGSAFLNVLYAILGLFGFFQWQFYLKRRTPGFILSFKQHIGLITLISLFFFFLMIEFQEYRLNTLVRFDILLSIGSIVATYLEIKKDTSCWYYWIIMNVGFTVVYSFQHLYLYAVLMFFLGIFSFIALAEWRKSEKLTV